MRDFEEKKRPVSANSNETSPFQTPLFFRVSSDSERFQGLEKTLKDYHPSDTEI
jgi:hypothetical protein